MGDPIKSIKEVKLEDFVKFVDKDKQGKIVYIGKVIAIEKAWLTIDSFHGQFGFKVCPENDLSFDVKPVGWDKYSKDPIKFRKELQDKADAKDVAPVVKTQKDLVFDLVKANKKLTRAKLFQLLKKQFKDSDESKLKSQMDLALLKA